MIGYPANRGAGVVTVIHSAFLAHGFSPNLVQEAPDTHTIMSLVGAGSGIGFVPLAAGHIKLPGVVLVPVPDIPPIPLALAWRYDDANPALRTLISLLPAVSAACRNTEGGAEHGAGDVAGSLGGQVIPMVGAAVPTSSIQQSANRRVGEPPMRHGAR
jgi:hypothetical protein